MTWTDEKQKRLEHLEGLRNQLCYDLGFQGEHELKMLQQEKLERETSECRFTAAEMESAWRNGVDAGIQIALQGQDLGDVSRYWKNSETKRKVDGDG